MSGMDAQALVNQVDDSILSLQSQAQEVLTQLQDVAGLPYLSWFDFAAVLPPALKQPDHITLGDLGAFQKARMGQAASFDFTPELFPAIEAQIMGIVESGGQNIAPAVQDAIFNQGYERLKQTTRDALDLAGARTGAKGFRYPNSMTKVQQTEITLNFAWQRSDLSRQIVREFADLVQKNLQMAVSAGVSIQEATTNLAVRSYTAALEAQRLVVETFKVETDANVAVYSEQLKTALAQLEADVDNAKLDIQVQEQTLNLFRTNSQNIIEMGRAQIQQSEEANRVKLEAIKGYVTAITALIQNMSASAVSIVTKKT